MIIRRSNRHSFAFLATREKCKDLKTLALSDYYYEKFPRIILIYYYKNHFYIILLPIKVKKKYFKIFILHYTWATRQVWKVKIIILINNIHNL